MYEVQNKNRNWVRSGANKNVSLNDVDTESLSAFPSGTWRGYYKQNGQDHSLFSFRLGLAEDPLFGKSARGLQCAPHQRDLLTIWICHNTGCQVHFRGLLQLDGSGHDTVGKYDIKGFWNAENGRMTFTKKYQKGTGDTYENLGHQVEYHGEVQGSFSAGIRGKWYFAIGSDEEGVVFHIWPECQQPFLSSVSAASLGESTLRHRQKSAKDMTDAVHQSTSALGFEASSDNECVVCFDGAINTMLRPCGHIALCAVCANRLDVCPICRAPVDLVDGIDGLTDPAHTQHSTCALTIV